MFEQVIEVDRSFVAWLFYVQAFVLLVRWDNKAGDIPCVMLVLIMMIFTYLK